MVTENNLRCTFTKIIELHRCTGKTVFLKYLEGDYTQWNVLAILCHQAVRIYNQNTGF